MKRMWHNYGRKQGTSSGVGIKVLSIRNLTQILFMFTTNINERTFIKFYLRNMSYFLYLQHEQTRKASKSVNSICFDMKNCDYVLTSEIDCFH